MGVLVEVPHHKGGGLAQRGRGLQGDIDEGGAGLVRGEAVITPALRPVHIEYVQHGVAKLHRAVLDPAAEARKRDKRKDPGRNANGQRGHKIGPQGKREGGPAATEGGADATLRLRGTARLLDSNSSRGLQGSSLFTSGGNRLRRQPTDARVEACASRICRLVRYAC